jgi:hypothetical protein
MPEFRTISVLKHILLNLRRVAMKYRSIMKSVKLKLIRLLLGLVIKHRV